MRVCLVGPGTLTDLDDPSRLDEALAARVPLGVLTLASVLEARGAAPDVVDLDAIWVDWRRVHGARDFARVAAEELARRAADVYGLSTICSSYPLTLRIAAVLKARRPRCRIVLGGPQATAVADETLASFPCVDVVVRGEGETTLPLLLDALGSDADLSTLRGVTCRCRGAVVRTPDPPLLDDLDALPVPAYHLLGRARRAPLLPIEAGRGCPFGCTFCSTSRFFGRRFRLKSPGRIVREMLALRRAYGTRRLLLVHDNFTVDRRRVVAFCEALLATGERLSWSCSSRTDSIDDDLVDLMAQAGCEGVFFGVESGSPSIQAAIGKRLDLAEARRRLVHVDRRRIRESVAFIAGFPTETPDDLAETADFFVDALRLDAVEPQLGLLSPLPGSPLHDAHRGELFRDEVLSDMVFQGEQLDPADAELVDRFPDLFASFYAVPAPMLDRVELWELRELLHAARSDLRWLLVAAARVTGGGMAAFRAFRAWRRPLARSPRALAAYYRSPSFGDDFVRFVGDELARRFPGSARALRGLALQRATVHRHAAGAAERRRERRGDGLPTLAPGVCVTRLECDGAALIGCLRSGEDLDRVPSRPSTLVTRRRHRRIELLRVTELAADLLELCDGTRDETAVASAFAALHPVVDGASGAAACARGLAAFKEAGLVSMPRSRRSSGAPGPSRASP